MAGIGADVFDGPGVEILRVDDAAHEPLALQLADGAGDAADGEAHFDAALAHKRLDETVHGQRRAARAGLEAEAVFEPRRGGHDLGGGLGHHQIAGILGHARGGGGDLFRIADLVDFYHVVHVDAVDRSGKVGVGHERVGDDDDLVGVFRIDDGVGEHAAVAFAADGAAVAVLVGRGRTDKGHVDVHVALLDGAHAAAVAAQASSACRGTPLRPSARGCRWSEGR